MSAAGMTTRGRLVSASVNPGFLRHIGWNLLGQAAPMLAALISIPVLIKGIGIDRFGILTIAWMLIGYFSLFDLGIGRAMTQLIAEKLAKDAQAALAPLIWTGLAAMALLGIGASGAIVALSDWAIYSGLNIPEDLHGEARLGLMLLAPAIPLTVLATGLRGILEARQQFRATNLVRIPLGVLMYAGPLCILPWSNTLPAIVGVLLLVRLLTVMALYALWRQSAGPIGPFTFSRPVLAGLMQSGGWMTVSNIISPVMVQADRFVIGSMLSMAAVAYYATPFEIATKMLLIPAAISGVAFPAFARLLAQKDAGGAQTLYWRSILLVSLGLLPAVALGALFAGDILRIWLHASFPPDSTLVFRILLAGVLLNGLAHIPFAYLQGAGRADITAKIHFLELPLYLLALFFAVPRFGIAGAAAVWTLRVALDALLMHFSIKLLSKTRG